MAIHFVLWFESLKHTTVASSTTIVCTEVIWVALGFCIFMKGKLKGRAILANPEDKKLHELIDYLNPHLRVSKDREIFAILPEEAYGLLESIAIISGTQGKIVKLKEDKTESMVKTKCSPENFEKCNIPMGAELIFFEDTEVKAIVVDHYSLHKKVN